MVFKCDKCGATFTTKQKMQRHLERKRPCEPVIYVDDQTSDESTNSNRCKYCGRTYSRPDSLKRHTTTCRIATGQESKDQIYENIIRKQEERFREELAKRDALLATFSARLEQLTAAQDARADAAADAPVCLAGFDNADRIRISPALVTAAFSDNLRLIEYCQMAEGDRVDPERAAPFVMETLMDLIRRVHKSPVHRNIYLSSNRADQVMVCVGDARDRAEEKWEVRSLLDVVRILFDGVAKAIRLIISADKDRAQLSMEVQSAVAWIPVLYEGDPDRFVRGTWGSPSQVAIFSSSAIRPTMKFT